MKKAIAWIIIAAIVLVAVELALGHSVQAPVVHGPDASPTRQ